MSGIYKIDGTAVYGDKDFHAAIAKTKLNGKVLMSIGDSYTVGMRSLFNSLASKYGMVHDNRGVGGIGISTAYAGSMYNTTTTAVSEYTNGFAIDGTTYHASDVGIITFMGGCNDGIVVEQDTGTGIADTRTTSIYGALHYIFKTLMNTFTNATIICIVQPPNYYYQTSIAETDQAAIKFGFESLAALQRLDDVQFSVYTVGVKENAVKEMAWLYEVPTVDMFQKMPSIFNPTNRSLYWLPDKLHLTTTGYGLVADAVDDKIVELFGGG